MELRREGNTVILSLGNEVVQPRATYYLVDGLYVSGSRQTPHKNTTNQRWTCRGSWMNISKVQTMIIVANPSFAKRRRKVQIASTTEYYR